MTRIIAGTVGGRTVRTPPGSGTRPTTARVREALFSALDAFGVLPGARVLDLYAGSGALGLEALSRGAAHVTFVESDPRVAAILSGNVRALGFGSRAEVLTARALSVLVRRPAGLIDLALVDPPYDVPEGDLAEVLGLLGSENWLNADGLVVVERSSRSPEPSWPGELARMGKPRRYGETTVWFAERA